ncbi:cupredoxin domain-containing protein, partial [Streptomyces sp. NPDC127574]
MRAVRLSVVTAAATAAALAAVTGCTEKSDAKNGDAIQVTAADSTCDTSVKSVPAGQVTLKIENKGSKATEVEILFPDDRIVSEKENIGPGTKYTLTAEVKAGAYEIACRPGMKGLGVRQKLTVTGGKVAKRDPRLDKAVAAYREYAQEQADATIPRVQTFADAIKAGDLEAAKKTFAPSRVGWETTEPI